MSSGTGRHDQTYAESVLLYALQALPSSEISVVEAHISACADCQQEVETLRPIIGAFVSWPIDVLRPPTPLWERLTRRIAAETGQQPLVPAPERRPAPEWEEAAPGISCKLLATDTEKDRVSMLVRLAPGAAYPPHTHAGVEELYLLDGELMIDDRKLYPGEYNRAEAGTADQRVWSETGCTCVLLTSTRDVLRTAPPTPSVAKGTSFRVFLKGLPSRRGYCLDCLSRLYEEPTATIRGYLVEDGSVTHNGECGNCGDRTEIFRPKPS